MKHVHVTSSTYIDFEVINKDKDPKVEVADHVRISNYKNIFSKVYTLTIGLTSLVLLFRD